ncbi:hypothetical protein [Natrinema sp. 1APR25-10V2]|uniref:hypothetical protein n=1 Tax=Natrinema sp. 1APR25-10V2 TaxID=2951081 RepID=UPI002874779C|nr:hypothetical protein [Natrinema sp. 1APR25-10V2]MDS0474549.1 hypothetical protein [Natrinema sp. 1APR25-10V2]
MKSRILIGIIFVLPLLLWGAVLYPGALATPYQAPSPSFTVAHESTEDFNDTVEDRDAAIESAVPVEELSEDQQRAFKTAKEQEPHPFSGRQSFKLPVCKDILLMCDEYEEAPEEPSSSGGIGYQHHPYGIVEDTDGEVYLVRAGFGGEKAWDLSPVFEITSKLLSLGVFSIFLIYQYWGRWKPEPTPTAVGYGIALVAFAFAFPYLVMFSDIASLGLILLPVITWCTIIVEIVRSRGKKEMSARSESV